MYKVLTGSPPKALGFSDDCGKIIEILKFYIDAQIIGRVEKGDQKQVTIESEKGTFVYD